ncbi:MAG: hypothetical protein NZ959_10785 [Armatimonadetes bacterium]|nr:hypothetical protein [Armatimonadota bacterium]MDW8122875.1 hypothetical protein [Armatimonadota bacterium]
MYRLVAVVLGLVLVGPVAAQEEPPLRGWTFRIGPWYPVSRDVRQRTDDLWVYFGVERQYSPITTISLDYTEGSGVDRVRQFCLFANSRQAYTPRLDLIGGLGIIYSQVRIGGVSDTRARLGATAGVSWKLAPRSEIQLRYQVGGFKEVNGFALTVNLHF